MGAEEEVDLSIFGRFATTTQGWLPPLLLAMICLLLGYSFGISEGQEECKKMIDKFGFRIPEVAFMNHTRYQMPDFQHWMNRSPYYYDPEGEKLGPD